MHIYDENTVPPPEYRVRPVVRYAVTRYCHPYSNAEQNARIPCSGDFAGSSTVVGEFANEDQANTVAEALKAADGLTDDLMVPGDAQDMADALKQISQTLGCENTLEDILHSIDVLDRC